MDVALLYIDGCPNWVGADVRLREALRLAGRADVVVSYRKIETPEQASAALFRGSPTILVNGRDPFDPGGEGFGLACRMYVTPDGLQGSPTVEQLLGVLG